MITSKSNSGIVLLRKLQQDSKYRKSNNCYCVEGIKLLCDAINHNKKVTAVYCVETKYDSLPSLNCPVYVVEDKVLMSVSQTVASQGIIAVVEQQPSNQEISHRCLILDNIADPGNMGTILRSATAFGYNSIIAVNCVDVYSPKVIRSAMSAHFVCNIICVTTIQEAFDLVKDSHKIFVADMGGVDVESLQLQGNIALVLGNEGNGVSQYAKDNGDCIVSIPMNNLESLNVAIAGSILMYLTK